MSPPPTCLNTVAKQTRYRMFGDQFSGSGITAYTILPGQSVNVNLADCLNKYYDSFNNSFNSISQRVVCCFNDIITV